MFEFLRNKSVHVAAAAILSSTAVAACSSHSSKTPTKQEIPTTSVLPPVAKAGEAFNCMMVTAPKTLIDAGVGEAAQALSPTFHEAPSEITAEARYGLATCKRSISADMAKKMGFVVGVENIDPSFTCITWTAIYGNPAEAQAGGLTNHIGLICVPHPNNASPVTA